MNFPARGPLLRAGLAAIFSIGLVSGSAAKEPLKVAFVFLDAVGDSGWTYQHDLGRRAMEKNLGSQVSVRVVADTHEGQDAERVARELSAAGYKLVFGASFGYMKPMMNVAADFPDTKYLIASGYLTEKNFGGYNARWQEGGYLAGIVAGKTSTSNIIGFVGAHPVPDVMWYLNAFALGAQSVNPKVKVHTVFTNSWFDPPKEYDAANILVNQGADVLAHFSDTPSVTLAAEKRDVGVISFHSDMRRFAPKNYLTGVTNNWGKFYTETTQQVIDGTWKPGLFFGGIADGVIAMAPMGPRVSKEAADLVQAKQSDIASGKFKVFSGPIKDQKGAIRVPAGAALADADLGKMDWFVQGIVGGAK